MTLTIYTLRQQRYPDRNPTSPHPNCWPCIMLKVAALRVFLHTYLNLCPSCLDRCGHYAMAQWREKLRIETAAYHAAFK